MRASIVNKMPENLDSRLRGNDMPSLRNFLERDSFTHI
jgi:hypothetical protein